MANDWHTFQTIRSDFNSKKKKKNAMHQNKNYSLWKYVDWLLSKSTDWSWWDFIEFFFPPFDYKFVVNYYFVALNLIRIKCLVISTESSSIDEEKRERYENARNEANRFCLEIIFHQKGWIMWNGKPKTDMICLVFGKFCSEDKLTHIIIIIIFIINITIVCKRLENICICDNCYKSRPHHHRHNHNNNNHNRLDQHRLSFIGRTTIQTTIFWAKIIIKKQR